MLPSDQVTRVVNHFPDQCEHCGEALPEGLMDPEPLVHQVTDIPVVLPQVTEHRRHRGHCPRCARKTLAQLPPDVPAGSFGLGVDAAVAYYTGARRCSRRDTVRTLKDLHHIDISLGAVTAIEERVSEALKPCVDQAADAIQQSKSLQRKLSQE
jgi:transposase